MNTIHRTALVSYSDQQMFELIKDVDAYQYFLPWCGGSEVIESPPDSQLASITISFKGVHKTFTTRNTLSPYREISLQMVDGPFSDLHGKWGFKALDEQACKISLDLEFDFSNRLLASLIEPVFKLIANSMLDSFIKRAQSQYGEK